MHHGRRGRDFIGPEFGGLAKGEGGRREGVGSGFFGFDELARRILEGWEGFAVAEEEVEEEDAEDAGEDVGDGAVAPDWSGDWHCGGVGGFWVGIGC